jgi:glycyl-tRNA synthetase beta chain
VLVGWLVGAPPAGAAADAEGKAQDGLAATLQSAASLAKADLVSQVVIEFPALQGTMGGLYARAAGLPSAVAIAVGEHYLPLSATAPLPSTLGGGLLAIADKIDNIVGAWVAGEKPSGSRDPYGLRRAALGIVRIALHYALRFQVAALIDTALAAYESQGLTVDRKSVAAEVRSFVWERLEGLLLDDGLPYDVVQAALASAAPDIPGAAARARALAALREQALVLDAAVAYGRCASLAAKAALAPAADPNPALFREPAEEALFQAARAVSLQIEEALSNGEVESALAAAAALRSPVDRYFDDVLVMDEDRAIRANRLAQLVAVTAVLRRVADFGRLTI